jgi:flavin reductase (DIM6/NTAB) family NADH-FMN oxidoreductase RutF
MKMRTIIPGSIPTRDFHQFLIGSIAPRPIAFVSTLDEKGIPNLAPYSFFNVFSSNPPIIVFSSNRRVLDNTTKDTLHNIEQTGEAVVNVVSYDIVRQMAVASVQWPSDVDEFVKTGLTPIASEIVKPARVKESPAHFECKLKEIIPLGEKGGAGHLIICDVVLVHIAEDNIDERGRIDPHKMDLMGRMGRAYYARASGSAINTIVQPVTQLTIGYDNLPDEVKSSDLLTGNDLGLLAGLEAWPSAETAAEYVKKDDVFQRLLKDKAAMRAYFDYARELLSTADRESAALVLQAYHEMVHNK